MIQKDFILRIIEQAIEAMAKAIDLKKQGDLLGALEVLEVAQNSLPKGKFLKVETHLISVEEIEKEKCSLDELNALGMILSTKFKWFEVSDPELSRIQAQNALTLLEIVDQKSGIFDQTRIQEIQSLKNWLSK